MNWEFIKEILEESFEVCLFVMAMMLIVELLSRWSHGKVLNKLTNSKIGGVAVGSILGMIPGCAGGFAAVSLYNSGAISFGALVAAMIAASGDEAFVMLSMFPKTAVFIILSLGVLGFVVGYLLDKFKVKGFQSTAQGASNNIVESDSPTHKRHSVLKHLPRVFLWTISVITLISVLEQYVDILAWVNDNVLLMVLLASLIGLIPESGPHLLFVTLFAQGVLPLPVLIASCISQDGHSGLLLISENKRSFFASKFYNFILAFVVGALMMLFL